MTAEAINLTDRAKEEVKNIMSTKGIPEDYGLRIGIKGSGCGAMGYMLGFDKEKDGDLSYIKDDINIYVEKKHLMYLIGLEVDFYDGDDGRGFFFEKKEQ